MATGHNAKAALAMRLIQQADHLDLVLSIPHNHELNAFSMLAALTCRCTGACRP
jgi:hypothetical protein